MLKIVNESEESNGEIYFPFLCNQLSEMMRVGAETLSNARGTSMLFGLLVGPSYSSNARISRRAPWLHFEATSVGLLI